MARSAPVFLYTDFGSADLYVGQVRAVLHAHGAGGAVIDLLNDAPCFDVASNAHLLAALTQRLPADAVVMAVVDPGVGTSRGAVALQADGRWFVGPDNGLLSVIAARSRQSRCYSIDPAVAPESPSFHGRDLFAPAAARLATGQLDSVSLASKGALDVQLGPADLGRIVYVDHYGNALTGIRASMLDRSARALVADITIPWARVFSDVARGSFFWYENSIGLAEIAANSASAAQLLALSVGQPVIFSNG